MALDRKNRRFHQPTHSIITMHKTILVTAALLTLTTTLNAAEPNVSTWVKFSSFSYNGKTAVAPKSGEYLNPIVAGFYPDPSICRVNNDYYLVNSSFQYLPGLPIWHSKDLVNWTQIGNIIDRPSQYPAKGGDVSRGLYAPTIRYRNGTFYVVCTLVNGLGNFYVTAKDPEGPWSDPIPLRGVGGIDPSFFFDDNGRCYVINCDEPPQGKPEYQGHRTIRLQEVDLDQQRVVGQQTVIVNGGTDISKHPVWCEGPHLYKVNKTYYLICAEGGTGTDHSVVVFKSQNIRGPYVPGPKNPMLTARDLPADTTKPVTCTGHADLVQTQNGEWFAVFLACQPYEKGFYNTGRQTFMLPVKWENDWPTILPPSTPVPLTVKKPKLPRGSTDVRTTGNISFTDNFDSGALDPRWVSLRAPTSKWYSTSKFARALFMEPRSELLSGKENPSYLAIRQQNNDFNCSVRLASQLQTTPCIAGLAAFQNEGHYYALNVKIEAGRLVEVSIEQAASPQPKVLATEKLSDNVTSIQLEIEGAGPVTKCFYKPANGKRTQLGQDLPSSFLSTETAGGFQGVTLGMFARFDAPAPVTAGANP
jgi:alpha-N-arabinofuranosidase